MLCFSAHWPAATKLSGSTGHNTTRLCRYCHKKAARQYLIPSGTREMRRRAAVGEDGYFGWLEEECPYRRNCDDIVNVCNQLD